MILLNFTLTFQVLSAGSEPNIFHWSFNGVLKAQIPCTPTSVYKVDVNTNSESNKVIKIGPYHPY